MASLVMFVLPLLLYAASLVDARPQYQLEKTAERTGSDWNKRPFHGKGDYYGFLTDEQKRAGPHPDDKYMDFLVGDKRTLEKKNDDAYWDFIGANSKRTNTRKKRSSDGGIRQKANPAGTVGGGDSQHPPRGSSHPRRLDPRSGPHDIESWDDFVLGKRPRDENMNFDDFLTGDKRGISDYDYAEFVLGKRP